MLRPPGSGSHGRFSKYRSPAAEAAQVFCRTAGQTAPSRSRSLECTSRRSSLQRPYKSAYIGTPLYTSAV
jgi:hypothetical protein